MRYIFFTVAFVVGLFAPSLALVQQAPATRSAAFHRVQCEGAYPRHLQGICTDEKGSIFWCFTDVLVKTDRDGRMIKKIPVAPHHGDLCYHEGNVFVAVNLGKFNQPAGQADSWVYVYAAADLSELARHKTPEVVYGAGGMACHAGRFVVIGGLPPGVEENYAYEYDGNFRFVTRHVIKSGYTLMGIQTAAYSGGYWWFGCYGLPRVLLKTDESFKIVGKYRFDCALGIVGLGNGGFLVAKNASLPGKKFGATLFVADADATQGLVIREEDRKREDLSDAVRPPWDWATCSPEGQGMSAARLEAAWANLKDRHTTAFLVVCRDRIVFERYAPGFSRTKPHYTASMAKALVGGMSLMLAMDDGRILPDDPASNYITAWRNDSKRKNITVRHLGPQAILSGHRHGFRVKSVA